MDAPLRIGLGAGRVLSQVEPLFAAAGLDLSVLAREKRRLVHPLEVPGLGSVELVLLRAADVLVYVEHGVCALGVAGKDLIAEREPAVLVPLDLERAVCRLVVAARPEVDPLRLESPRVATKYPRVASRFFLERGAPARIIELTGSIEVAPLVGLADAIVDVVETGETLRQNGLVEKATVLPVSARLVVNRSALKVRTPEVRLLLERLRRAVRGEESP